MPGSLKGLAAADTKMSEEFWDQQIFSLFGGLEARTAGTENSSRP